MRTAPLAYKDKFFSNYIKDYLVTDIIIETFSDEDAKLKSKKYKHENKELINQLKRLYKEEFNKDCLIKSTITAPSAMIEEKTSGIEESGKQED